MSAEPAATLSAIESFHIGVLVIPDVFLRYHQALTRGNVEGGVSDEAG